MGTKKGSKESETLIRELKRRSQKALELAKKMMRAEKTESKEVREALEHYIRHWNDFTHPSFFSIACEAVGADPTDVLPVQAAMTIMAAAFDIHDDIIDESKAKHGVPTVFGKFGEDVALLLGDAFLIEGSMLFDESLAQLPRKRMREVLETLKMALFELGDAHALELEMKRKREVSPDDYARVLEMKASSVEGDMKIGALVGGGTRSEIDILARFGRILGILATLREEFIDVFEVEELEHRTRTKCLPLPILYAIREGDSRTEIQKLVSKERITSKDVDRLVDCVFRSSSVVELKEKMQSLVTESFHLVSNIRNETSKKLLRNLTQDALEDL